MNIDKEEFTLTMGDKSFELEDIDNDQVLCEIDIQDLMNMNFTLSDFLDNLIIRTHSPEGFGTYLFYELEVCKIEKEIKITFICRQPNKYWEGQFGLSSLLTTLADIVNDSFEFEVEEGSLEVEDDWKLLNVYFTTGADFNFGEIISHYSKSLIEILKRVELILSGTVWKDSYESDEKLFCTEIIFPLLRKMGFIDVRFNHGIREYGKDFTFSEITKFGNLRHFAIQAKAGNLRGNVNSDIDEIIGQLNDTFAMPYYEVSANESRNISTFIVAISGHFTENAKEKIIHKIPPYLRGCIYFIDKDKTLELIEKHWK